MIKFDMPAKLNGSKLVLELENAGIEYLPNEVGLKFPVLDAKNDFYLRINEKDIETAKAVLAAHNG